MRNINKIFATKWQFAIMIFSAFLFTALSACAGKPDSTQSQSEIHWIAFPELEQKMKEHPKKVIVDVYTSWCGWCKVLDKKTYSNPDVIKYINDNFYAVKFDAEQKTDLNFIGQTWEYLPAQKVNRLALELLQGRLSYPTTVIMGEDLKTANPIPGFMEVPQMEMILKYFGGNNEKTVPWADWQKNFKGQWVAAAN